MKKFFSKFILKKNNSYIKIEVEDDCAKFNSENINIVKFNDINIDDYIKSIVKQYLEENNCYISKGEIVIK